MSYLLPPPSHPAREMFDVADLVGIGTGQRYTLTMREAIFSAQRTFAANRGNRAMRRLIYIVMAANDDLLLISIGRRGGRKVEWNFSK